MEISMELMMMASHHMRVPQLLHDCFSFKNPIQNEIVCDASTDYEEKGIQ